MTTNFIPRREAGRPSKPGQPRSAFTFAPDDFHGPSDILDRHLRLVGIRPGPTADRDQDMHWRTVRSVEHALAEVLFYSAPGNTVGAVVLTDEDDPDHLTLATNHVGHAPLAPPVGPDRVPDLRALYERTATDGEVKLGIGALILARSTWNPAMRTSTVTIPHARTTPICTTDRDGIDIHNRNRSWVNTLARWAPYLAVMPAAPGKDATERAAT